MAGKWENCFGTSQYTTCKSGAPDFHSSISMERVHEVFLGMKFCGSCQFQSVCKQYKLVTFLECGSKVSHLKHSSGLSTQQICLLVSHVQNLEQLDALKQWLSHLGENQNHAGNLIKIQKAQGPTPMSLGHCVFLLVLQVFPYSHQNVRITAIKQSCYRRVNGPL